jgi:hypothetical protein
MIYCFLSVLKSIISNIRHTKKTRTTGITNMMSDLFIADLSHYFSGCIVETHITKFFWKFDFCFLLRFCIFMNNKQKIMKMIVKYVMQEFCNMCFYNFFTKKKDNYGTSLLLLLYKRVSE